MSDKKLFLKKGLYLSESRLLDGINERGTQFGQADFPFDREHRHERANKLGEVMKQDKAVAQGRERNVAYEIVLQGRRCWQVAATACVVVARPGQSVGRAASNAGDLLALCIAQMSHRHTNSSIYKHAQLRSNDCLPSKQEQDGAVQWPWSSRLLVGLRRYHPR